MTAHLSPGRAPASQGPGEDPHHSLHSESGAMPGEHPGRSKDPLVKVAGLAWLEFEKPGAPAAGGWADVCPDDDGGAACFEALTRGRGRTIIVRPDRVIAAVATRDRLPRLPWSVPAAPVPRTSQMIRRPAT